MSETSTEIREQILALTKKYAALRHADFLPADDPLKPPSSPEAPVPYAGRVFSGDEMEAAVGAVLDFWLTLGAEGDAFSEGLAKWLGVKASVLTNSGSSANLLAVSALTSPKLGARRLLPGDEVITCAAGFPTTVAPIVQNGAVPVFLDADPLTLNARMEHLEEAFCEGKTKAVIFAHTLGNPFDLRAVTEFCKRHGLWLIEDNCDALGALYDGKLTGTFGDLSTQSFYPPHHLTMGEGGAVNIRQNMQLKVLVESFRDWGRDCWCASGRDNTCRKRFGWQLGDLPEGYDHKYIYSHLGYNLKPLDIQAAIGRVQLTRLPAFVAARRRNWEKLRSALEAVSEHFEFQLPTHASAWGTTGFEWRDQAPACDPSWFGFMLLRRPSAPFTRVEFARHLDMRGIGNRTLFGGNLPKQPAFTALKEQSAGAFRIVGSLEGSDRIMNDALFVGVYPGLTDSMMERIVNAVLEFVRDR